MEGVDVKKPKKATRKIVGSRWRILAHRGVLGHGDPVELYSQQWHSPAQLKHMTAARQLHVICRELVTPSVFDELCLDDWLHLEQMSARHYWMAIGPLHVNVTIGKDGRARISIQRDGDDRGERVEVFGDVTKARKK